MHYTSDHDILVNDNSFVQWSAEELEGWKRFTNDSEAHVVYELPHMASATGASTDGFLLGFPMLPQQMMQRGRRKMLPLLRDAVTRARKRGAKVLGLGGFTSIISRGGELLTGEGIAITSGSCLTAVMIRDAVHDLLGRFDLRAADLRLAVVGAAGAIGRLASLMLAPEFCAVTLIGSGTSVDGEARTHSVAGEIYAAIDGESVLGSVLAPLTRELQIPASEDPEERSRIVANACQAAGTPPPILVTTDAAAVLRDADVIVCATSASSAFIESAHIRPGAILIDAARPQNVSAEVADRGDVFVVEGGLVELPQPIHFGPNVQGFRPGVNLACLAETMLLALEGDPTDHGIGQAIALEEALRVDALARRHGFRLAPPHRGTLAIPEAAIERFRASLRCSPQVDVA